MVEEDETCNLRPRSTSSSEPCLSQRQAINNTIIASLVSGARDEGKVFIKHHFYDNDEYLIIVRGRDETFEEDENNLISCIPTTEAEVQKLSSRMTSRGTSPALEERPPCPDHSRSPSRRDSLSPSPEMNHPRHHRSPPPQGHGSVSVS